MALAPLSVELEPFCYTVCSKNSTRPVNGFGNKGPFKVLKDSRLILNESK